MGPRCALCGQHIPLQGFGPLGSREFQLGDVKKNTSVFSVFLVCGKEQIVKSCIGRFFQHNS